MEQKFDEVASTIALKMGVRDIPWYQVTLYLTLINSVVTVLTLFSRADFLNVRNNYK